MDDTTIVGDSVAVMTSPAEAGWAAAWSGVSWSAVIAGTLTAIAVTIIVIALGSGIGFVVASPYASSPSAETMTVIGALWLVFAQAVGFATGGYIAGRLRRTPTPMHTSEVKLRDGANGLVVWAIGVVVSFLILATAVAKVGSAVGSAAAGTAAVGIASASQSPSIDYFSDTLLRPNPQTAVIGGGAGAATAAPATAGTANGAAANGSNGADVRQQQAQINRILATALTPSGLSNDDRTYLAQLVAAQTGMSQDEAQKRVDAVVATDETGRDTSGGYRAQGCGLSVVLDLHVALVRRRLRDAGRNSWRRFA